MSEINITENEGKVKLIFAIIVIAVLIGIYYITKDYVENRDNVLPDNSNKLKVINVGNTSTTDNQFASLNEDNDGDGIVNWREDLYGLDRNTHDSEKLSEGIATSTPSKKIVINRNTNLTEVTIPDIILLGQYAQEGKVNATSSYDVLIRQMVESIRPKEYTGKLNVVKNLTNKEVRAYHNNSGLLFYTWFAFDSYDKELEYYNDNLNKSMVQTLYNSFSNICLEENVSKSIIPYKYEDISRKIINLCNYYVEFLNAVINKDNDQIRYQAGLILYVETLYSRVILLNEYKELIKQDNITFSDKEYGNIFNT